MRLDRKQLLKAGMIIACLAGIFGCTPKFIVQVDGYPSPEEVNDVWSQDGSITARWFGSRWFIKRIQSRGYSEDIEYPEHLLFDRTNILPSDTRNVVINLQVYNPRMKKYRLVRIVTIDDRDEVEPFSEWTIREVQHSTIPAPVIPGKEIRVSVKIVSVEGEGVAEQVISTGELSYLIAPSERDDPGKRKGGGL